MSFANEDPTPPTEGAIAHLDERGRIEDWAVPRGEHVIHLSPGAHFWRFYIMRVGEHDLIEDPKYKGAITAHVYDTAEEAYDAAVAWLGHPYKLVK